MDGTEQEIRWLRIEKDRFQACLRTVREVRYKRRERCVFAARQVWQEKVRVWCWTQVSFDLCPSRLTAPDPSSISIGSLLLLLLSCHNRLNEAGRMKSHFPLGGKGELWNTVRNRLFVCLCSMDRLLIRMIRKIIVSVCLRHQRVYLRIVCECLHDAF